LCIYLFEWKQLALQAAWNDTNGMPFEDGMIRDAHAGLLALSTMAAPAAGVVVCLYADDVSARRAILLFRLIGSLNVP
jgi:hypothetical protein